MSMNTTSTINPKDLHFYQVTNAAYWFGMLGHGGSTILFWVIGMWEMALFNLVFSVPSFALAIYLNKRGSLSLAFAFAFAELLLHQVLATYYLGWDMGAHYFIIYLAGLLFFNPRWSRGLQLSLLAFISVVYVAIYFAFQEPVYAFHEDFIMVINTINGVSTIVITSLLINYFAKNTYASEQSLIKEKELTQKLLVRVESLFGQQISQEVAHEMIDTDQELEAKNFDATIMFIDIRDFTVFADSRSPKEVASFQNTVLGAMIDVIQEQHGVVNQLLGDGLMAVFGAPKEDEHHADHAVEAGNRILEKVNELVAEGKIPPTRLGIGLNSGNIIAGNIGNETRKAYSLTGKNVIIAARIEPLNKRFSSQFLVADSVLTGLKNRPDEVKDLGEIPLKGIEQPVRVWRLK